MYIQDTLYHSVLRILGLTLALVLLFDSGVLVPATTKLSDNAQQYVANVVGVAASVEETELSTMTAALTEKETELKEREAALQEREIALRTNTVAEAGGEDISTYLLSVLLFILLALIILNYGLDFARYRKEVVRVSLQS
jgi:hypothetical protein